jgi:hypothetical protein
MPIYRVYSLGEDDRILGPPRLIECADDESATQEAQRMLNSRALEVWNLTRRIAKLEPASKRRQDR